MEDLLKNAITSVIVGLSPDVLNEMVNKLIDLGVSAVDDLSLVNEKDLTAFVKPIQARKLVASWLSKPVSATLSSSSNSTGSAVPVDSETNSDEPVAGDSGFPEGRPLPSPYILCKFPEDVQRLLDAGDVALATQPQYRKKLRKALCEDMARYTLCPSSFDYNNVCSALVRRYPFLSDKVNRINIKNASPYQTWKTQIRDDFKSRRRPLTTIAAINLAKEKFGRKRPRDVVESAEILKKRKTEILVAGDSLGEDERTVSDHISVMTKEMTTSSPNLDVIDERMNRTFAHRQKLLQSAPVDEVLATYPALSVEHQIFKEFERGCKTKCVERFQRFWNPARITTVLNMAKKKKECELFVSNIGEVSTVDVAQQRYDCALMCLPVLLREKLNNWVVFDKEVESLHPCVRVTNGAAGISNYDNASYVVYLDKKSIFKASKLAEAIIGMFCLYFIFGVEYPRSLRKTCVFLSGHVMGFSEPQLPTVQSFFNKLSC